MQKVKTFFEKIKKKELAYCGIVLAYFVISVILLSFHEPWRDESQAWVLSNNLTWPQIASICASEGHPCLWFYLVKLTIVLGIPFEYFGYVSIFFMTLAVVLFLWYSDLKLVSKCIIILSPIFFYYNPVICRIYSVLVLLICVLCSIWKERHNKPILYGIIAALLFQSHVLIFGIAIGCIIDFVMELIKDKTRRDTRHFVGVIIPIVSLLLAILELKQNDKTETFINVNAEYIINRIKIRTLAVSIASISNRFNFHNEWVGIIGVLVLLIIASILIACLVLLLKKEFRNKHLRECVVFLSGTTVYLGIVLFVRGVGHIQMAIVLWMMILFLCWTVQYSNDKTKIFEILIVFMCVLCIPKTILCDTVNDIKGAFSGSKEMAQIVNDNVEKRSAIIIRNDEFSTSIVAYLADTDCFIWDIDNGNEYTIHKWGHTNQRIIDDDNLMDYIQEDFDYLKKYDNVYYVDAKQKLIKPLQSPCLESIDGNKEENTWNEYYWLYKVQNTRIKE